MALDGLDDGVGAAAAELAGSLGVLAWVCCRRVAGAPDEGRGLTVVQTCTWYLPTGLRLYMV